jgi:hypothetical protein
LEFIISEDDPRLQRDKSKFLHYFVQRQDEISRQINFPAEGDGGIPIDPDANDVPTKNEYKNAKILETFSRWNVYSPLWSKIAFAGHDFIPKETVTTGHAEAYFG